MRHTISCGILAMIAALATAVACAQEHKRFDWDRDGDVDLADYALLQQYIADMSGAFLDAVEMPTSSPTPSPTPTATPTPAPTPPPASTMQAAHRTVASVPPGGHALFSADGNKAGLDWQSVADWSITPHPADATTIGMIAAFVASAPGDYTIRVAGKSQTVRVEGFSGPTVTVDTAEQLAQAVASGAPGTVLLRGGRTYTLSMPLPINRDGPMLVASDSEVPAIIDWTTGDGLILDGGSGWEFQGVTFRGPGASQLQSRAVEQFGAASDILFYRCTFESWGDYGAVFGGADLSESQVIRGLGLVHCMFRANAGRGLWLQCRDSWLGFSTFAREDALRIGWAQRTAVTDLTIEGQSSPTDANWRIHGQPTRSGSRWVTFARLNVTGAASGDWSGEIAPTNAEAVNGCDDIQVLDSRFGSSSRTQVGLRVSGQRILIDSCEFNGTNAAKIYGPGWYTGIVVNRGGTAAVPTPTDIVVRNCRAVRTDSANNCYLLKIDGNVTGRVTSSGNTVSAALVGAKGVIDPGGRQPN